MTIDTAARVDPLDSPDAQHARTDTPWLAANVYALRRRHTPLHAAYAGTMLALASLAELDSRSAWGARWYSGHDIAGILGGATSTAEKRLRELAELGLVTRSLVGRKPVYRPLEHKEA